MQRKIRRLIAAALTASMTAALIPQAVFAVPEAELVAGSVSQVVRSEPSEYGLIDEYAVDENGNRIYPARTDKISLMAEEDLPSSYRSEYVTSVKNQGQEGTCWAHAGIGSMEANLVKKGLADKDSADFSEAHMAYFGLTQRDAIYNDGINYEDLWSRGGNTWEYTAALQKWSGLELEENMPYSQYANQTAIDEEKRFVSWARVKKAEYIDTNDKAAIKNAIMQYGAVYLGYKNDSNYYNEGKYFYYANECNASSHSVLLVGWDDSISAENFAEGSDGTTPSTDGAWIIKNSWGESWGDNGYFYMSYENAIRELCVFDADLAGEYDNNYGYTGGVWQMCPNNPQATANIFTAKKTEALKAIGVTVVEPTDIDIYIFKNLTGSTPDEGTQVLHQRHSMAGVYEEITLDEEIPLAAGEKFSVVIDGACVYFENSDGNYSYNAGESYTIPYNINYNGTHASSLNGSGKCQWTDTATGKNEYTTLSNWIIGNAYIRAYTDDEGSTSTPKPIPTPKPTKTKLLRSWDFEDGNTAFTNIRGMTMSVVNGTGENQSKTQALTADSGVSKFNFARAQLDFSEYIPDNAKDVRLEFDAANFTEAANTDKSYMLYDGDAQTAGPSLGRILMISDSSSFLVNGKEKPSPNTEWVHITMGIDCTKNTCSYSVTNLDGSATYLSDKNMGYFDSSYCNKLTGIEIINSLANTAAYIDNIKLYATTPLIEYNVKLNTNGGTVNSGNIKKYTYGTGATLPTNVTKDSCKFEGWYDNAACTGTAVTSITATDTGDKTYWAKWRETVTYTYTPAKVRNEIGTGMSETEIDSDKVWLNVHNSYNSAGAAYFGYNEIAELDPSLIEKAAISFTAVSYNTKNRNRDFTFDLLGISNNWTAGREIVSSNPHPTAGTLASATGTLISSTSCRTNSGRGDVLKPDTPAEFDVTNYVKTLAKGTNEIAFGAAIAQSGSGMCELLMKNNPTLTITMTKAAATPTPALCSRLVMSKMQPISA